MPTDTFFRLPEEKRKRLIDAAWDEFTTVKYADASINKIIRKARIPRGSFYQYFTDKEDLFIYLLNEVKEHILRKTRKAIVENSGGLFEVPVCMFEELLRQDVLKDAMLTRYMEILDVNPRLDVKQFCVEMPYELLQLVMDRTDLTVFREKDPEYLHQVIGMVILYLGAAIIETLLHPEQAEEEKRLLQQRVEIIRYGCCRESVTQTGGNPC